MGRSTRKHVAELTTVTWPMRKHVAEPARVTWPMRKHVAELTTATWPMRKHVAEPARVTRPMREHVAELTTASRAMRSPTRAGNQRVPVTAVRDPPTRPPTASQTIEPKRAPSNSEMDRIARPNARVNASKPAPSHRRRKQQSNHPTGADKPSKTAPKFPVPHAGEESNNQKARDSKGPAPGSFGPVRRGQAHREKTKSPETSKPVRRGQAKSAQRANQLRNGPDR